MKDKAKVGVYVCHCGINIAGVINVDKLTEYAKSIPNVVVAKNYKFMCSENGQDLIQKDIKEGIVNRVVVAACSPRMHESTFRLACQEAGLNQFLFEQANIREHATWVNLHDSKGALEIAKDHVRMAVAKVTELKPLELTKVPVEPSCLVVGAGIAGMNAALDLAKDGYEVYLVEKEPSIGGHMAQLDKTFPTMDCSACILTPKTAEVGRNERIHLYTYSEVESVDGYVGNFDVTIKKYPHYIDQDKCTGCGTCAEECLVECGNEFDLGMKSRKAAYIPFPQAVPGKYTIDMKHCIKCGICEEVCPVGAVNYEDKIEKVKVKVGTVILATGYDPYDPTAIKQYGFGKYENVITAFQMERLLSSVGPTGGKVKRPSDMKEPESVIFVQCVGSRDFTEHGHKYCSRVCCMYATKQARQYKEKHPKAKVFVFYIDLRAFGKGYEEFYNRAGEEYGIRYIRGKVSEIYEDEDKNVIVRAEDTLIQREVEIQADLVVLSMALEPRSDLDKIARIFNIQRSEDGFIMEAHPKLGPVETLTEGIFIAGSVQGPKDIPDTVAQAKAAASSAAGLMAGGEIAIEPYYSTVLDYKCAGCKSCISVCAFNAITFNELHRIAEINTILCKGCGTCVSSCPSSAIVQNQFGSSQLNAIIKTAIPEQSFVKNGGL
ncbi:MAG: FAD-dependent oxidoreductase [Candidatus Thorarchaeota archaeon]